MKVEEVVPSSGLLPSTAKLTLIISKDDSASSSSDGADSGCLAESPEFGKDDSLGHSDGCLTPDMARRAGSRQPSGGSSKDDDLLLRPEDSKALHIHSKSSSTTSEESSGNLGPEEWSSNSFPSRVVTSYIEINCNKRDIVASDSATTKMESNDVYNRINMQDSNDNTILDNGNVSKTIDSTNSEEMHSKSPQSLSNGNTKMASNSNSAEDLSDSNSNDSYKLPVKSMESQSNSGTEDMSSHTTTTTNSMSDDTKPSQSTAITANANCSHEITLSLSQLSDFEVTKQKIKEMRKSFLTNLASDGFTDDKATQDSSAPASGESSFLVHLQNKRANRLKQKMESQQVNPSLVSSRLGYPNHLLPADDSSRHDDTNHLLENRLFEGMEMKDWMALRETSVSPAFQRLHSEEQRTPKIMERYAANLDIVNANAPAFPGPQASSLPPSVNVSPIHCVPLVTHGQTFVPRASSHPCSPYHSVLNPNQARSAPIPVSVVNASIVGPLTPRKSFFKDPLGQCYGECLSRSADSKTFNIESKEIHKQYFRTRSLEEGNKATSKQKSSSPVSSIKRVFSHHRSPKNGVSPLDSNAKSSTNHLVSSELNGNFSLEDHTYENTMSHLTDKTPVNGNAKNKNSSSSEHSNMWLFEKTAQLLRLKKNGLKDKRMKLGNGNKSDSDSEHTQQKRKLKEACKNVAHALFSLPNSPERTRETRSQSPPSVVACARLGPPVGVEQVDRDSSLSRQVRRRQHLLSAAESSPRNSFHESCPCPSAILCQCSDSRIGPYKCSPEGLQRSPAFIDGWQKISLINRPSSAPNITEVENRKNKPTRSIKRNLKRSDHDATTSSDDDYADDYCQTDECGDDCDYCSGDDAGDEEEDDVCDRCQTGSTVSSVCKHSRVLTNGILKSSDRTKGRVPEGGASVGGGGGGRVLVTRSDHQHRSMPTAAGGAAAAAAAAGATARLQQHPRRRRSATSALPSCSSGTAASASARQHGLGAIRESSATSDDQPDTDEEQYSHDGSNCDLSRSWRFGLSRDAVPSRDSTLCSDSSSTSVPVEHFRLICKEKSNSLPGAYSRPLPADPLRQRPGSTVLRLGSTSEEETGISLPIPCPPTRPPRAPRTRCPSSPNPTTVPLLSTSPGSPRPTMGVQGLQRSPNMPRPLHVSGLPTSPRLLHAPRTVAPRSPNNPNPPYGFSQVAAIAECPPPGSPKTSCRAGGLVTRNFSISDDENGRRCARRQVTISRHETAYREAAERGYILPPGSPVDPYWLTWKLGVLQKTLEEVDGRLEAAEASVSSWGPVPQDPNLADQHVHNVTKFREGLSELQRGVDDVNDQAARFSAHSVPLAADTSTRLHRLNSRWKSLEGAVSDRWRHVAGRSREVTPLTAAQLASTLPQPWERAVANNKVPYYINHAQETTYWDHPEMMALLDSLADLNHIKFSAYRTASKLRALQKKLALDQANLQLVTDVFDEHGLRGQNDRLIDVSDMVVVLSTLYGRISSERPETNTSLTTDLCLNWLLNVYDSQRTGQMRVLSFRVGLVCLCKGHLEEKYRYMFRLIADPNRLVDQRKLGLLLHDCVQVPRQLGEVAAFGGSNIEPSVRSCFTKAGKDREAIEAVHFLSWVQQEPQSLVWLAVLHRVAASEHIQHQVKCNICKTCPIVGLRYRCLKCIGFDMCQQCFFDGRSSKNHKVTHPMHEYCTATTAGDEMKDFTKALKNKFKSKRSLQKHAKKGYLPVQTVLEGDPLESPSPSPQHGVGSQDMHNRLELYASRLAEVELRTNSNSTPDSEDEHGLIAQYCQSLSSGDGAPLPVPRSPLQVMAAVDADQKDELEQMIRELEEENQALQAEYEQLKLQQEPSDSPSQSSGGSPLRSEAEMLAEARLLRQHKGRLEARMTILEQHNQQLEAQLHRLRQLLQQQNGGSSPNKSGTLQTKSVTASQLATDSPAKVNGHSSQAAGGPSTSSYEGLDQMSEYVRPPPPPMGNVAHVGNLFSRAGDLERAVGSLVATVTLDQARDSPSAADGETSSYRQPTTRAPEYDRVERAQDDQDEEIEQYDNNPMPAEKDR